MECEECEPCGRTVTFGGLRAVGTDAATCRVRFVTRSLSGRDLSAVELLRHPVAGISEPLGGVAAVSVTAEVDEAPAALMAVLVDDAGGVLGTAPFTLHDLPPGGQPFELPLSGSATRLHFVARDLGDLAEPAALLAKASVSPDGQAARTGQAGARPEEQSSSWSFLDYMIATFSCASSRNSCFALPKMATVPPVTAKAEEPRLC